MRVHIYPLGRLFRLHREPCRCFAPCPAPSRMFLGTISYDVTSKVPTFRELFMDAYVILPVPAQIGSDTNKPRVNFISTSLICPGIP